LDGYRVPAYLFLSITPLVLEPPEMQVEEEGAYQE
jgi:hypothetical protein